MTSSPSIEYFYAAHSAFAYLGSSRLREIAGAAGRRIEHRPFDLRRLIPAVGSVPTSERTAAHRRYFFRREIARWGEERNVEVLHRTPTHHANDIELPNCFVIAAIATGVDVWPLSHALLQAHWRDDVDLAEPDTLVSLAATVGLDGSALLQAARGAEARAAYEANTEEAIERSVFGSPTYFVDGDMFYGQDRLEMVERAMERPYRA